MVRPLMRLAARASTARAFLGATPLPREDAAGSMSPGSAGAGTSRPSGSIAGGVLCSVDRSRTPDSLGPAPLLRSAMGDDLLNELGVSDRPGGLRGVIQDGHAPRVGFLDLGRQPYDGAEHDVAEPPPPPG